MADLNVSAADVAEARAFLRDYLRAQVPDLDLTEGGVNDDHLVKGFSFVYAYLAKLIGAVRARNSVLTLLSLAPDQGVDDAADALLANLYVARDRGRNATGTAQILLSARVDVRVEPTHRFFKTRALAYLPDTGGAAFTVSAGELTAVVDASGAVTGYLATGLPLVAARPGREYNTDAGPFAAYDAFNPYVVAVANPAPFVDGLAAQSTADLLAQAEGGLTLRGLLNARSNRTTLTRRFPGLARVATVGMGDPEMARDLIAPPNTDARLHIGGKTDVYVDSALRQAAVRGVVGAAFPRPDGLATIFRQTGGVNFLTGTGLVQPVVVGDVLVIHAGLPEAPTPFVVRRVAATELEVSARTPFTRATDEDTAPPTLTYSIGDDYPAFADKLAATTGNATTSRSLATTNRIMLPGGALYAVKSVRVLDPGLALDPWRDPTTDDLVFTKRLNAPPAAVPLPGDELGFFVEVLNPAEAQSARAVVQIEVGWPGLTLDGKTVEVLYDTLGTFDGPAAYVADPETRLPNADVLVRARHPVYLAATVPYRTSAAQTAAFAGAVFDEGAGARAVASFVASFSSDDALDVSALVTQLRGLTNTLAAVYPFAIAFELAAPDGRVYRFVTTDRVTVFPNTGDGVTLLNPTDFGLPATGYEAALKQQLLGAGVSDRTVRYLMPPENIAFDRRT